MMRNSIRTRLSMTFIGLATIPLLLVGSILTWQSFTIEQQQALNLQREVARRVAAEVTAFFKELENELSLVSRAQILPELDLNAQQNMLKLLMVQDVFEDMVLLDDQGQERIHLARLGLLSTPHSHEIEADEFVVPQTSGKVYYSPVRFEEITGEPLITIAVPLLDIRSGLPDGVLISEVRIKKIWDLIADIRISPGQSVYILDAQENVVAHRNPSVVLRDTRFPIPEHTRIQSGLTGEKAVLACETLHFGEQTFHVVAEQTVSKALALAINTVVITAVLIVVALVIAVSLGFLSIRQIVRPIQAMASTAEAISAGELSRQVTVASQDEFGVLATAFNSMTTQLRTIITDLEGQIIERQRAEDALREKTEELDRFFSVALDLLCIADTDGYFRRLNPQWEVVLGYSLPELEGQRFLDFVHPEDLDRTLAVLRDLETGKTVVNLNFANRYRCIDGSYRWIEWRSSTVGNLVYAAARDITERKQAEEALRESEQKFRAVAQNAQAVIFILDSNGVFLLSEGQELTKLGLAPGQVVGMSVFELYRDYPTVIESITRALSGESVHTISVIQDVAFDTVYSPYYNLEGEQIGVIGIAIDITERQRMEKALQESEFFLRKSQSVAQIGSYYFDARTGTWKSSPALDEIFGIDDTYPKNVEGWTGLIHSNHKEEMLHYLSQYVLTENHRFDKEYQIIRHDNGQERWMHGLGELEFDDSGNAIRMIGTIHDITDRKLAEIALQERNRLIDTILENAPIGFGLTTIDDGRVLFMNRKFEEIYGIPHGSLTSVNEFFDTVYADPIFREQIRERVIADIASGDVSRMHWENIPITTMTGKSKFITATNIPLWEQNLMISTVQDVTERKRAEDEIRRLNTELEARVKVRTAELEFANRELKDFAYVVSHDLKAPLRAISRLASWLREDYAQAFDKEGHEMIDLLVGRVKRLDNLIDGILEYSRIGRVENAYIPVDFNQLLAGVLDSLDPPEHIHIRVAQTLPTLIVEKTRIFQVLQNLIGNAIKFINKPQGEIEIRCREEEGYWKFSIVDNGPGIDPKHHDRIFQIFQTLRPRDEFESTGIGLALVKKIVELHGGKIWLESKVGEGSQFFFTLPQTSMGEIVSENFPG